MISLLNSNNNRLTNNIVKELKQLSVENQLKVYDLIDSLNIDNSDVSNSETQICYCIRCGRPIKQFDSINQSMGPVCYRHFMNEHKQKTKKLF
jgi:uncharacterized protein YehS (DUF1456 family)